jgi:hypothetical protein
VVAIDEAGDDALAAEVDDLADQRGRRFGQVLGDGQDAAGGHHQVAASEPGGRVDLGVAQDGEHGRLVSQPPWSLHARGSSNEADSSNCPLHRRAGPQPPR